MTDIPDNAEPALRLSAKYEPARRRTENLRRQNADFERISRQQHQKILQVDRRDRPPHQPAAGAPEQPSPVIEVDRTVADTLRERLRDQRAGRERSRRTHSRPVSDHQNAYLAERQLDWQNIVTARPHADAAKSSLQGPVRYQSAVGGPDIVDGHAVQAETVTVHGRQPIPARTATPVVRTVDTANRDRTQATRVHAGRSARRRQPAPYRQPTRHWARGCRRPVSGSALRHPLS